MVGEPASLNPEPLPEGYASGMSNADADASELGRALAARRWDPETRLRAAVDTVVTRAADLDPAQRAALGAAIGGDGDGDRDG